MERLQKYMARCGVASRRKSEELITNGHVKVNGVVVTELGTKVNTSDVVMVDDNIISANELIHLVMNKPRGIISSSSDDVGRNTVISILPKEFEKYHLFPVGRLDYDTKGVLLITNDGEFMNTLVGPKSNLEKEYYARVSGIVSKEDIIRLCSGLKIENYTTRKCRAKILDVDNKNNSSLISITIKEGKNHQVKKMCEAIGHPVKHLTRVRFGEITTDGLGEGEVRYLTPHEIKRLVVQSKEIS